MQQESLTSEQIVREPPWSLGLRAARANLVPGLIVQGLMLGVLLAYYFYPPTRDGLDRLAEFRIRMGYGYSALNSIVAGALIPEVFRILIFQGVRVRRANVSNLFFSIPCWCMMGLAVDFFYRCQADWFGDGVTFGVIAKKVVVDQFLYNPFFSAPLTTWLYDWKMRGFRCEGIAEFFTMRYYRDAILPTLFATWGVWIPVVAILYSLPQSLQIPLFGLALSMWVILYTWMSEKRAG